MPDLVRIQRALLSVSDKTGLAVFAKALQTEFAVELLSTGGTARELREAGLVVRDVGDVTDFPEMMDGRVKTLHPKIHGGLLAVRDNPAHAAAMAEHGIEPIDLIVINLYPFEQTVASPNVSDDEAIENIDIGGPAMIRSAAKNHAYVTVVTAPQQYEKVLDDLAKHGGSTCAKHRRKLAQQAFARTNAYDGAIAQYLANGANEGESASERAKAKSEKTQVSEQSEDTGSSGANPEVETALPQTITLHLEQAQTLRYGENPHQRAAIYVAQDGGGAGDSIATAKQLHGKQLSYINLLDADAAVACVREFTAPAACIVKHATPCGVATGDTIAAAFAAAYAGDPLAAFGGIVALNHAVDLSAAQAIVDGQKFLELIVAPSYAPEALATLQQRWKNCRLLELPSLDHSKTGAGVKHSEDPKPTPGAWATAHLSAHAIKGGFLVQQTDEAGIVESEWKTVSKRPATAGELRDLKLAWLACKHVKSNAIVIAKNNATVGIGGGAGRSRGRCSNRD